MSKEVDKIFDLYSKLTKEQIIEFNRRFSGGSGDMEAFMKDARFAAGHCCPFCGSVAVSKNGKRPDGVQRYICKDCGKSFTVRSNSIVARAHKDMNTWELFIECMMNGLSLRKTAEICGINKNTAFVWRHKVLDVLQNMMSDVVLDGIVEADETFFPVSYKGNHKNSKTFKMPRKARHHGGGVRKRGISKEQVCVPCAVNRSGMSYSKVSNLGHITIDELHAVFDDRITDTAELCTDKMSSYRTFANDNGLTLHQFKLKEPVKGIYSIQHINNYHSTLKHFMYKFRGVSTKYLNNYLVWNNLVNYSKDTYTQKKALMLRYCLTYPQEVLGKTLRDREPIPLV